MNPCLKYRHRSQATWLVASLLLSCGILPTSCLAQGTPAPQLIPFQGRLTNQAGEAYGNNQYTITLNLYSLAIGGSTVWTERHEKVSVIGGMLNLFLGSINGIDGVDFSTTKYLGITVDADNNPATADPEMVPRTMIVSAFSAKQAERSRTMDVLDTNGIPVPGQSFGWNSVFNNGNPNTGTIPGSKLTDGSVTVQKVQPSLATAFIPTGAVLPFAGMVVPNGWAICDGSSKLRTDPVYATLFGAIGTTYGSVSGTHFNLPDLRGRTPIGAGQGSSLTNRVLGDKLGEEQHVLTELEMPSHKHNARDLGHSHPNKSDWAFNTTGGASVRYVLNATNVNASSGNNKSAAYPVTESATANITEDSKGEGLPHNVMQPSIVLNYIIKL